MKIKYTVPKPLTKAYASLRIWAETRDKYKRLSEFFGLSMTEFLDSLADQMIRQFVEDPNEAERIKSRSHQDPFEVQQENPDNSSGSQKPGD